MKFDFNIIKWYPFESNKKILQIGKNENISKELEQIGKLTIAEDIDSIQEKYDYILIYGYQKKLMEQIEKLIKEDTKILLIGENELGINNWSKYTSNKETGVQRLENHHNKLTNIIEIENQLKKQNYNTNIFYVFPNYEQTELIINEKFEVQKMHIEKYYPNIKETEIRIFDEIKTFKNIINTKKELLKIFANSYFIEASKQEIQNGIRYCSFNNCRKPEYRLITMIRDNLVEKVPAIEEAKNHIQNMKETIAKIKEENIDILDYEENGHLYSKLIKKEKTLDRILYDNREDLDKIVVILNMIKEILIQKSIKEIPEEIKKQYKNWEKLHFMKNAYWDMIAKNCFYIENKFVFFDQEWEKSYLPVEFIIYRSVINSYDLVRAINVDELLEKLEILQYKEKFEKIDYELRKEIIDEQIYEEIYGKDITNIDNIIYEHNVDKQKIQQVKEDNENKQKYIEELEKENENKQKYIENLEEDNKNKQEYILSLEQINTNLKKEKNTKKGSFWKRK